MALDSTLEVQKALVAALRGSPALAGLVGQRIYDQAPADAGFPFVSFGPFYGGTALETFADDGFEVSATLDVWSRSGAGRVEALQIMAAIVDVLHRAPLPLDTQTAVLVRLSDQRILLDQDGVTHHGVQRWQLVTD